MDIQWQVFSISKSECLTKPFQMQLSHNRETFAQFFSAFVKSASNLKDFERKYEPQKVICFWDYRLQKADLLKCPKCPV